MQITHVRHYQTDRTIGTLVIEGREIGTTLEDIGRPAGIKIPHETCIPEGEYSATISMSAKFGRPMILLFTNPKRFTCEHDHLIFEGVRVHAGAKTSHTSGCVLIPDQVTLHSLENLIGKSLKSGEPVTWTITREQQ